MSESVRESVTVSAGAVRAAYEAKWEGAAPEERALLVAQCARDLRRLRARTPADPATNDAYAQTLLELATGEGEPSLASLRACARSLEALCDERYFAKLPVAERLALHEGVAVAWRRAGNLPRAHSSAERWAKLAKRANEALDVSRAHSFALEVSLERGRTRHVRTHATLALRALRASPTRDEADESYARAEAWSTAARTARTANRARRMALGFARTAARLASTGDPRGLSLQGSALEAVAVTSLASRAPDAVDRARALVAFAEARVASSRDEARFMALAQYADALGLVSDAHARARDFSSAREAARACVEAWRTAGAPESSEELTHANARVAALT